MKEALKGLFSSRKALMAMGGMVATAFVLIAGKQGWVIDFEAAKLLAGAVLGLAGLFIAGQGAADWGKEAAKIQEATFAVLDSAERAPELDEEPESEVLVEEL
jgi:hypothetical protein